MRRIIDLALAAALLLLPAASARAQEPVDDAELHVLQQKAGRLATLARYDEALDSMDLPADKLARLKDLIVDEQALPKGAAAARTRAVAKMKDLIGAGRYDQMLDLQRQSSFRLFFLRRLGPPMAAAGDPLKEEQADALAWAAVDGEKASGHPAGPYPTESITAWSALTLAPTEKAASVLSPKQMAVFQDMRKRHAAGLDGDAFALPDPSDRDARMEEVISRFEEPDLDDAGVPMTPAQTAALARVESAYCPWDSGYVIVAGAPSDPKTGLRPMDENIVRMARRFLRSDQLNVLALDRAWQARLYALTRRPPQ